MQKKSAVPLHFAPPSPPATRTMSMMHGEAPARQGNDGDGLVGSGSVVRGVLLPDNAVLHTIRGRRVPEPVRPALATLPPIATHHHTRRRRARAMHQTRRADA